MNTGVISNRYATALLKYVQHTGNGKTVCSQAEDLLSGKQVAAMAPELENFTRVLSSNGRINFLRTALVTFVHLYHESVGEYFASLKTAVPLPGTEKKIASAMEKRIGCKLMMSTQVDPSIVGGFVFSIDNWMLDASIKGQMAALRRQLLVKNKRIV